jgi:DNA polymerase III epsilon subunit-like protein
MPYLLDQPQIDFKDRPILFIDLEMTGLDVEKHEIVEIGALLVRQPDFKIMNSYYTKVAPTHIETGDPKSLRVIRYAAKDWADAIPLKQALMELSEFAPNCMLAGWCVQNEWDFLNHALAENSLPYFYSHRLIEVFSLAYAHYFDDADMRFISLPSVSRALGVHIDQHKPDSDIRATYEIFRQLVSLSQNKNSAV